MKSRNTQVDGGALSISVGQTRREQAEKKAWDMEAHMTEALSPKAARMLAHELRVHQIELEMQNEELRRAQTELEFSRARYFDLYDLAPAGYCTLSEKGLILEANLTVAALLGTSRSTLVNELISRFILKEDQDGYYLHRKQLFETGKPQTHELRMVKGDGTTFWAHLEATVAQSESGEPVCRVVLNDVTERKLVEICLEMDRKVLQILNEPGDFQGSIQHVLTALKTFTGFDAVGIRLQDGDDFPYFVQQGFPNDFLLTENTLVERGAGGGACRNGDGSLCLECTCGLVLSGKTDPSHPLFTKGGSFWNNDTFPLLDLPSGQDPRLHPRNNCIHQGYASVALVPIRSRGTIVGLIQFNDRRKGRFTLTSIDLLERVAAHIGEALLRKQAEEALHASESRYRRLFEAAQDGILILDAESGQIRDINPFLMTMLGYMREEIVGRKLWEIGAFGDTQKSWDEFLLLQTEEYVRYGDLPLVRKDGTLFEVEFISNVYMVDDKKVIQCNIRDVTEHRMMENTLRFLAQGTGTPHGENFFQTLARYLAETLGMDFVCIDRLEGDGLTARTVAVWCDGKFEDNVVYALKDTPCGEVVGKTVCCFPTSVCSLFPRDAVLQDLRADSYVGVTLWSHMGHPIGLIAVIGRKPLSTSDAAESVLKLVAVRAAAELEREQSDAAIRDIALFPEQNPSPILRVGADGRLQYANLSADPLLLHWDGIEIGDAVPLQIAAAVTKALTSGSAQEIEIVLGSRHLSFVLAPIRSWNYVNLYGRDITTLKHAQAQEKEAKAFASAAQTAVTILESMGEAVLLLTMDGYVKSVNPALEKMVGIPARELIGQTLRSFFPKILAAGEYKIVEAALADVLCGETPSLPNLTLMSRNGHRIPVIPAVSFILGTNDKPAAVVITLRDISILRNAQESLESSEKKYRELVENANSIIMRITPDHTITFFNEYAQTFFGYTDKEILGKNVRGTIIPSSDSAGRDLHELLAQITENPEVYRTNENENICKDGRRVWIHWANRAVRDDQGKVTEILCIGTDITEQKKDQQAIETYQAELRALSSGLALAEEQARRQLSVALHDTVGQTLALTKIKLGSLGRLVTDKEPKAALDEIREMFDAAVHQTRTLSFELSPPILYELGFAAAVEWLGEDFGKRYGFQVCFKGTDQKYAVSEPVSILFFQSARELLANIVKHAGATKVNISFTDDDGRIVMEIGDNGKGLDPENAGGKDSLGLFSIRERMKHIGGTFEIRSGRKRGTTAKLSAPMQEPESAGTGISRRSFFLKNGSE